MHCTIPGFAHIILAGDSCTDLSEVTRHFPSLPTTPSRPILNSPTHIEPTGYCQLIRENANFRLLWLGQIASLLGDWFNLIASAALVATLTKSGFAVGGLFMVRMLAPFLVSPIAGVVADRYDRKIVLIWADLLRGVTVFGFLLV